MEPLILALILAVVLGVVWHRIAEPMRTLAIVVVVTILAIGLWVVLRAYL